MGNSESRPSPGEDLERGSHGGDGGRDQSREPRQSRQATSDGSSGADRSAQQRIIDQPPQPNLNPGAGPPDTEQHSRGWREDDPEASDVMPAREHGAGGGKIDGPRH